MFDLDSSMKYDPEYAAIVENIIDNEEVPQEFMYKNHECRILRSNLGHLCGYVRVHEDHPFYGLHYSDSVSVPLSVMNNDVDLRDVSILSIVSDSLDGTLDEGNLSIASILRVHGGVTFSGNPANGEDGWWYGFDCAHAGDYIPASAFGGTYKEVSFVENQCKLLVEDLMTIHQWNHMI
jgi:hypothetical protein